MQDQILITVLLTLLIFLFIFGKFRFDAVSLVILSLFVLFGFISPSDAFSGFSHPAVITVALVLLISKGLEKSGLISFIGLKMQSVISNQSQFMFLLLLIAFFLSSFMNNIGAMAMLLPITLGICQKMNWNPSKFLMPLAFASILGGMNTKIGTPPNIIISEIRGEYSNSNFNFFDFSYVGIPVCIVGILFIAMIGWRLIQIRPINSDNNNLIELSDYLVEMVIENKSKLIDKTAAEFRKELNTDTSLIGYVNEDNKKSEIHGNQKLFQNQILIFKLNPEDLVDFQQRFGLKLFNQKDLYLLGNLGAIEAIITPGSRLIGRKYDYFKRLINANLSLLGLWRRGLKYRFRLANETFKVGDVLLLANRGERDKIGEKLELAGLLPLWNRDFDILRDHSKMALSLTIFIIALCFVIFDFLPIIISFLLCVLAFVGTKLIRGDGIYKHIEWPVIILLGAMIPIGETLTEYGLSTLIASYISYLSIFGLIPILIILIIITMFLSDIINNAATAVIMAPIAVNIALKTNNSVDIFLMAVAIGSSCAFLSPIGHQCNTLVMGPGNYKFSDYWKLGLPLEIIIIIISIPCLIFFWG